MEKKRILRRALGLVLTLALLLPLAGPGMITDSSASQSELNSLREDANSLAAQKKEIKDKLAALQADKDAALAQRDLLEEQIFVVQQEINNINKQIAMYDVLIAQKEAELRQAQEDEAAQYKLFCERIRYMEEQGETSYWAILFDSSSFSELLDNYMMIEEIIQYDNDVMNKLAALQTRVAEDKAALEEAQSEQQAAKDQQVEAQNELKGQEAKLNSLIEEINSREDQLEAMEREIDESAKALDSKIKQIEREMAAQIKNVPSESGFLWPLAANLNVLSSLYGPRLHPVTHKPGNHAGIDIPAAKNTPIYAAKSGVVTTSILGSGSSWSYGNYVVISHSDGTSTLYAHMDRRNVSKGQVVSQGDVIGYVGLTGRTTGYHLHFEVRVNGDRTDPVNFFKDKQLYVRDGGRLVSIWD